MILPATLKRIQFRAFAKCGSLTTIALPPGLQEIGEQAFAQSAL